MLTIVHTTAFPTIRMLVQTLSNVVTANEELMATLWGSYLDLPQAELVLLYVFGFSYPSVAADRLLW